ncbi:MAG: Ig-like domain-containing protein [Verrucomicrobiota bacterium]
MNTSTNLIVYLCTVACTCATYAEQSEVVEVNLDVVHSVDGINQFQRERHIVLHSDLRGSEWAHRNAAREPVDGPNEVEFHTDYDVYFGRATGNPQSALKSISEHPDEAGRVDPLSVAEQGEMRREAYANDANARALESYAGSMMIGAQHTLYPNGQIHGGTNISSPWSLGSYEDLGDFFVHYFRHFYGNGGASGEPKPKFFEIMNEPFVKDGELGTTTANLSDLHRIVAEAVKTQHPDIMVGGYAAAWPEHENGDFSHWISHWRRFINRAGAQMDFFSVHLYDTRYDGDHDAAMRYRSGSNIEAILDLIEHYSLIRLDTIKPMSVSEYGYIPETTDGPYSKSRDWQHLAAFNKMLLQFLERPNTVIQSIPFMQIKGEWGRNPSGNPYHVRLLRQQFEQTGESGDDWVYTELIKFFQLWQDVTGVRVDTWSSDIDLQVDAYVDGRCAYVILNNTDLKHTKSIDLNLAGARHNPIIRTDVRYLYADENTEPVLDEYELNAIERVTLAPEGTMILKFEYESPIIMDARSKETKYYATGYMREIENNTAIDLRINGVGSTSSHGEAILRLGIGRQHWQSPIPTEILFNGVPIDIPHDFRGNDQGTRGRFYGVLEVPVPYELVRNNNQILTTFQGTGGFLASLALQVFEFSKAIARGASPFVPFDIVPDTATPGAIRVSFRGQAERYLLEVSSNLVDWESSGNSIVPDESGYSEYSYSLEGPPTFFRLSETELSKPTATTLEMFPRSGTVSANGVHRILSFASPTNAKPSSVQWRSSNPGRASVSSNGEVFGLNEGTATIVATTENGLVDTATVTVGPSSPTILFDDPTHYREQSYRVGETMEVRSIYDAGTNYAVNATRTGIRYLLRELTSEWAVVRDIAVFDVGAIGTQSGGSVGRIQLPYDLTPSVELPDGNFYFLFVQFGTDNPTATNGDLNEGVNPIVIEEAVRPNIEFDSVGLYRGTAFAAGTPIDVTCNFDAGSGAQIGRTGIHYRLREMRSDWAVVRDYEAYDHDVAGERSGVSSASIMLPRNITPSSELPPGNFYFLYVIFDTDFPGATSLERHAGVSPVTIVSST